MRTASAGTQKIHTDERQQRSSDRTQALSLPSIATFGRIQCVQGCCRSMRTWLAYPSWRFLLGCRNTHAPNNTRV
jgi:hypothetical protein